MKFSIQTIAVILILGCGMVATNALGQDRLGVISTRGQVLAGDDKAMFAGFKIEGSGIKCGVVRVKGPSMRGNSIKLEDPILTVLKLITKPNGNPGWETYATNDDWQDQDPEDVNLIELSGLAPANASEPGIFGCFEAGETYQAVVTAKAGTTVGNANVEVIDQDPISEIQGSGDPEELQSQINNLQSQLLALQLQLDSVLNDVDEAKGDIAALNSNMPTNLNDLADVSANPSAGQVLGFTGSTWAAVNDDTGSGGTGGSYTDQDARDAVLPLLNPVATSGQYDDLTGQPSIPSKLNDLTDVFVNAPVAGQVLKWGGGIWSAEQDEEGGAGSEVLDYMSMSDADGFPELVIAGVNVRITSGGFGTGAGNLIVGMPDNCSDCERNGTHNLVVGLKNSWTNNGSVVFGRSNSVEAAYSSVLGGGNNKATDQNAVVLGGSGNQASATFSVVTGGEGNSASGAKSVVVGGDYNSAGTTHQVVTGVGN